MYYLYNIAVHLLQILLPAVAWFNPKISRFLEGRKETFSKLEGALRPGERTLWFHCASLGEFEQGRPVIEGIKEANPDLQIVLSFFSPSGYEVRKDYPYADVVVYLPLDTASNARRFVRTVDPAMAVFVKYEFWPNLLKRLKQEEIPVLLISGAFRKEQVFFRPIGGWMRRSLQAFSHFFVQDRVSGELLRGIGFDNVDVSGDTRFDRVSSIAEQDNSLDFLEKFTQNSEVLVAGSTWPKDERFLVNYINDQPAGKYKYILAPHNVHPDGIRNLKNALEKSTAIYTENRYDKDAEVFIVDTVGILTKVYSYADLAYVGGGYDKEGIHNILEPAAFGIPLVIGPIYDKFLEAFDLVALGGCIAAQNESRLHEALDLLFGDPAKREELGTINANYVKEHQGATQTILNFIEKNIGDIS